MSDVISETTGRASVAPRLPAELGTAMTGFLALGLCAGLGAGDVAVAVRAIPSGLLVAAGTALLTGPALLVSHPFLGLEAPTDALLRAMMRGFCVAGTTALGLAPVMLFFAATSGWWFLMYPALFLLSSVLALGTAGLGLVDAEVGRSVTYENVGSKVKILGLVVAWLLLAALVGLRLGAQAGWFVLFG
jgi:hypothetical protein